MQTYHLPNAELRPQLVNANALSEVDVLRDQQEKNKNKPTTKNQQNQ